MTGEGFGKSMVTDFTGFGAEKDIIMILGIQYSIDAIDRSGADGAGGEAGVEVRIIRRIESEVSVEDTAQAKFFGGENDSGVGLE